MGLCSRFPMIIILLLTFIRISTPYIANVHFPEDEELHRYHHLQHPQTSASLIPWASVRFANMTIGYAHDFRRRTCRQYLTNRSSVFNSKCCNDQVISMFLLMSGVESNPGPQPRRQPPSDSENTFPAEINIDHDQACALLNANAEALQLRQYNIDIRETRGGSRIMLRRLKPFKSKTPAAVKKTMGRARTLVRNWREQGQIDPDVKVYVEHRQPSLCPLLKELGFDMSDESNTFDVTRCSSEQQAGNVNDPGSSVPRNCHQPRELVNTPEKNAAHLESCRSTPSQSPSPTPSKTSGSKNSFDNEVKRGYDFQAPLDRKYTLADILRCFFSETPEVSQDRISVLLGYFHDLRPTLDVNNLPRTGRALMKPKKLLMEPFKVRTLHLDRAAPDGEKYPGKYVHYKVEECLKGRSPGQFNLRQHMNMLRRVEAAKPEVLSEVFHQLANPDLRMQKSAEYLGLAPKAPEILNRALVTHFDLNIHIDGVQIFKNSRRPEAIPIQASIHMISGYDPIQGKVLPNGVLIPLKYARPFVIGCYHGRGKPDIYAFLKDMFDELDRLDPDSPDDPANPRTCTASIRCFICDSPMKAWLTGTCFPGGYVPCQRCKTRGDYKRNNTMYYPDFEAPRRTNRQWKMYSHREYRSDSPVAFGEGHIKRRTPINDRDFPVATHFTIDPMHVGDGGILRQGIRWIFSVGLDSAKKRVFPVYDPSVKNMINDYLDAWHVNVPSEYSRRPNHIEDVNSWKMRECNVTSTLMIPAILKVTAFRGKLEMKPMKFFMKLVGGIRLLGGFRIKPVSPERLDIARDLIHQYLTYMKSLHWRTMTFLAHSMVHIADDAERFRTQIYALSAYQFENFVKIFPKFMKNSRFPLEQLTRKLATHASYFNPSIDATSNLDDSKDLFEMELALHSELGTLDLPPNTVKFLQHTTRGKKVITQKLICEGFTLTNRFPNNIAFVHDDKMKFGVSVVWVTGISRCPDLENKAVLHGFKFLDMDPSWKDPKFDMSLMHSYKVKKLDDIERRWTVADEVIGKGFAMHLVNVVGSHKVDPRKLNRRQQWIVHLMDHCAS